jgi:hypothetical protein
LSQFGRRGLSVIEETGRGKGGRRRQGGGGGGGGGWRRRRKALFAIQRGREQADAGGEMRGHSHSPLTEAEEDGGDDQESLNNDVKRQVSSLSRGGA